MFSTFMMFDNMFLAGLLSLYKILTKIFVKDENLNISPDKSSNKILKFSEFRILYT